MAADLTQQLDKVVTCQWKDEEAAYWLRTRLIVIPCYFRLCNSDAFLPSVCTDATYAYPSSS